MARMARHELHGMNTLFGGRQEIAARAVLIGERLDLRALEATDRLASTPLVLPVTPESCAVLFRYGVTVLFDVPPVEEVRFIDQILPMVANPAEEREQETLRVAIDPQVREGVEGAWLRITDASIPRLQVIADVLGKSVALAAWENRIARSFDQIEPLAATLQREGRVRPGARQLVQQIGTTLMSLHRMVGRVEVGEKPEILWERPELESLYLRLEDEFELKERQLALERKLEVISRTAQTLIDLLQAGRSLRVEWYIVALILFEILLSLYEMFVRPAAG